MRRLFFLLAVSAVAAGLLTATGSAAGASSHVSACASQPGKSGRFSGIVPAQSIWGSSCLGAGDGISTLGGNPPLLWGGGPAMGTDPAVPITITPIYWEPNSPNGFPLFYNSAQYRNLINQYLADVAAASGSTDNVYSTATEYYGSNGPLAGQHNPIHYNIVRSAVIRDHDLLPKGQGCWVAKLDTSNIYSDGSGYSACLDDAQITAEIQKVISGNFTGTISGRLTFPLPSDYNHEYVMITPKHVASCFYAGSTASKKNVCTLTHYPSAGYCAYHTMFGPNYPFSGTVYANMPYPIYQSSVGFTCGSDGGGHGIIESPHYVGDQVGKDADVEVSPLSHEIMESITDPNTTNGWFDASGNENGDDCAYVYGEGTGQGGDGLWNDVFGSPGYRYNQTINGDNWLTQEEFSNADWFNSPLVAGSTTKHTGGCVRGEDFVTPAP